MEDHFDKLLYLVIGVIYLLFFNNAKSDNASKRTEADEPSEHQPAPTANPNWTNTWENKAPRAPVERKTLPRAVTKKASPYPVHRSTSQLATQQLPPSRKIDRVLHRYSGWKKAVIMAELIQPRA
jgi:hypothetical protein